MTFADVRDWILGGAAVLGILWGVIRWVFEPRVEKLIEGYLVKREEAVDDERRQDAAEARNAAVNIRQRLTILEDRMGRQEAGHERLADAVKEHGVKIDRLTTQIEAVGKDVNTMAVTMARVDERLAAVLRDR